MRTRCGDLDLSTLARLALGRVLIFRGDVSGGVRLLDEAMVAVNAGELSPIVVGDSYCAAIDACHDVFDVRRGQIWTAAFSRWSDTQPDLVPYAGLCLVHRSEFLQLKGAWVEAMAMAGLARRRLLLPVVQLALSVPPFTSRASCTGCVASLTRRSDAIARPATREGIHSRGLHCFGSPRRKVMRQPTGLGVRSLRPTTW